MKVAPCPVVVDHSPVKPRGVWRPVLLDHPGRSRRARNRRGRRRGRRLGRRCLPFALAADQPDRIDVLAVPDSDADWRFVRIANITPGNLGRAVADADGAIFLHTDAAEGKRPGSSIARILALAAEQVDLSLVRRQRDVEVGHHHAGLTFALLASATGPADLLADPLVQDVPVSADRAAVDMDHIDPGPDISFETRQHHIVRTDEVGAGVAGGAMRVETSLRACRRRDRDGQRGENQRQCLCDAHHISPALLVVTRRRRVLPAARPESTSMVTSSRFGGFDRSSPPRDSAC